LSAARACVTCACAALSEASACRDDQGFSPTVSVGIATFDANHSDHADVESLARAADRALYQAKADGRNRVEAA
jgi:diguanylate cyclase (GGDEF)-like protein